MTTSEPCATDEDDWFVECSDEENHKFTPDDMREMYEKLARGDPIELDWKCPGRRPPTPEKEEEKTEVQPVMQETAPQPRSVIKQFDFETSSEGNRPLITPRRTKGITKTPRSNQKRVACFDKIMDNMLRHKRMDEEAALSEQLNIAEKAKSPQAQT